MRAAALLVLALGCKADAPEPAPAPGSQAPVAAPIAADAARASGAEPITALVPSIEGAKFLTQRARDDVHVMTQWCIDEHDAVERVMAALRAAGWTEVRTRGAGDRIGVAATKGDARFSASAGGRDERCAGTLVSATIMRLGGKLPELAPGEKIR